MHLLNHFKELTVRPKNAQELKSLILQLAVKGKLTGKWRKKNSTIESASELLKHIQEEKVQLVKDKKIKKEKPLQPIAKNEIPYDLPKGWVWCRLNELTEIITKGSSPKWQGVQYVEEGEGILFVTSENVGNYNLIWKKKKYVESKFNEIEPRSILKRNDLLMNIVGGSIGRTAIYDIDDLANINQAVTIIRLIPKVIHDYFLYFFNSPLCISYMYDKQVDNARPNLSMGNISKFLIPFPSLEEQKAIVQVVETLFKEVEQLEQLTIERISLKEKFVTSALNQLTTNNVKNEWAFLQEHFHSFFNETTNIKKLRETVLQLAVQGKLTADWRANNPNLEDASELLNHIKKEKVQLLKDKKIKKEKPLLPITKDEIPYELPNGWVWCRVGEIFNVKSSKRVFKSDYVSEGVPFFRSKEIGQLGKGQEVTTELFITRERFEMFKNSFGITKPGDVLMACIGGSIGNTWLVDDREFYYKDGNLVQIDSIPEIDSLYLLKYLDSNVFYDSALGRVSGSAYSALTIEKIKNSLFPLSNEQEQKAIVQKVNALMGLCDALEQQVQQSQKQSEQLMQSVLREVFEGKKELKETTSV